MKVLLKIVAFSFLVLYGTGVTYAASKTSNKVRVRVEANGRDYSDRVVSMAWEGDTPVTVTETTGGKRVVCVSQCETTPQGVTVYWKMDGTLKDGKVREYVIESTKQPSSEATTGVMSVEKDREGNIILKQNDKNVLQYNTQIAKLPRSIDPAYCRAGYIHPAWSPAGYVLTNVNPVDHRHHYGIWNPWTSVLYDGQKYDLWNLVLKQGTVRVDSVVATSSGDLFAGFQVKHLHVIFRPGKKQTVHTQQWLMEFTPKEEIVIMDELLDIKAWNTSDGTFMWDFVSDLEPATALPVILKAYRYAGFGFRATAEWTKDNCQMVTSEGKTRPEIDGTNARWIYTTGECSGKKTGILAMSYPTNHKHPEPLRIWNERANGGRGDAFFNFAPSKNEDWTLEPGHTYQLRYRVVTYDGEMTPERAEALWQEFANEPKLVVK